MWTEGVISSDEVESLKLGEYYVSGTNEVVITMKGVPGTGVGLSLKYQEGKTPIKIH